MSPAFILLVLKSNLCSYRKLTFSILEPLLDDGIVNVGQDFEFLQILLHADKAAVFDEFPPMLGSRYGFALGNSPPLILYLLELLLAVGQQQFPSLLKTLIWKLLKGDVL